jgi:hypothetical protein
MIYFNFTRPAIIRRSPLLPSDLGYVEVEGLGPYGEPV